jgi:hypothetical protein
MDIPLASDRKISAAPSPSHTGHGLKIIILLLLLLLAGLGLYLLQSSVAPNEPPLAAATVRRGLERQEPPDIPPPSRYGDTITMLPGQDSSEQQERRASMGLDKSLDVVIRSDENVMIGEMKIPAAELERQLALYRGEISEQALEPGQGQLSAWGIHLVRPGDNLWRIHLNLLGEYMASRGVTLAVGADQPLRSGYSSDLGKMLKFAEHMVGVFNLETRQMSHDLNLLEPGEKIVVFNLSEIFRQMENVDLRDLRGLIYDGRVLIFPQKAQP